MYHVIHSGSMDDTPFLKVAGRNIEDIYWLVLVSLTWLGEKIPQRVRQTLRLLRLLYRQQKFLERSISLRTHKHLNSVNFQSFAMLRSNDESVTSSKALTWPLDLMDSPAIFEATSFRSHLNTCSLD
jgi:hypothetical protein